MPTLKKRQSEPEGDQSKWYIVTSGPNHPFTFQLEPKGYKWLLSSELGHESSVDWDVFETLRSLDLVYTLDSSYTPADAPSPKNFSFEELPPEERVRLAEELLDEFSTAELSAQEGTLQFLLSFGDSDWECQEPVLEKILIGTPFDALIISDYRVAFDEYANLFDEYSSGYNPLLLAMVLSVAYDAIEPMDDVETINEGDPIWVYDGWVVCAGSELIFHAIKDEVIAALSSLLYNELAEASASIAFEGHFYTFLEQEFAALSEFQFIMRAQDLNPWLGKIIADGLRSGYRDGVLILPGVNTEKNGPFEASDEPGL